MSEPNDNKDNPTDLASSKSTQNSEPQSPSSPRTRSLFSTLWGSFLYLFAGAVVLGLILNLLGYGYTVSPNEGLRIDTLSELRMEQQLQPPPSDGSRPQPGGLSEFFLKNPFTTSLVVTGIVLAYETLLDKKSKNGGDGK